MGRRKNVQASNKTKGNTKPISSGRLCLNVAPGSEPCVEPGTSFMFQDGSRFTLQDMGQALENVDDTLSSVGGELRVILKKMRKKDVTTRRKALDELSQKCSTCDADDILAILPYWPRIYIKLASFDEWGVREGAHIAQKDLALAMKKQMVPHLKDLAAVWFTGQCDPYPVVAAAAICGFEEIFPGQKQIDMMSFCHPEILHYFEDNIINQTPQTVAATAQSEDTSIDQMESQYHRILYSCFMGLRLYLEKADKQLLTKTSEFIKNLLEQNKFIKHAKSTVPQIRQAWFSVIVSMCKTIPAVVLLFPDKLCPLVLGNVDESDYQVIGVTWDAVFALISVIKDWYVYVGLEKMFIPKLCHVLKSGGFGHCSVVYPHVLPVLTQLHVALSSKGEDIIRKTTEQLLNAMKQSLDGSSSHRNPSQKRIMIVSYIKCLSFLRLWEHQDDYWKEMAKQHIFYALRQILYSSALSGSTMLQDYHHCLSTVNEKYKLFVCEGICTECINSVEMCSSKDCVTVCDNLVDLLLSAKGLSVERTAISVKFDDICFDHRIKNKLTVVHVTDLSVDCDVISSISLNIAASCVKAVIPKSSNKVPFQKFIAVVLHHCVSSSEMEQLFGMMYTTTEKFFNETVLQWLKSEDHISGYCITIALDVIKATPQQQLNVLQQLPIPHAVITIQYVLVMLEELISHESVFSSLKFFLNSSFVTELIVRVAVEICNGTLAQVNEESDWGLLAACFSSVINGEYVCPDAVEGVLYNFTECLQQLPELYNKEYNSDQLNKHVALINQLATLIFLTGTKYWGNKVTENLILSVMNLICQHMPELSSDNRANLMHMWKCCVQSVIHTSQSNLYCGSLTCTVATNITNTLLTQHVDLNVINDITSVVLEWIGQIWNSSVQMECDEDVLRWFLSSLIDGNPLNKISRVPLLVPVFNLSLSVISLHISDLEVTNATFQHGVNSDLRLIHISLYALQLMTQLMGLLKGDKSMADEDSTRETSHRTLLVEKYLYNSLGDICYVWFQSYLISQSWICVEFPTVNHIAKAYYEFDKLVKNCLKGDPSKLIPVLQVVFQRSVDEGGGWSVTLSHMMSEIPTWRKLIESDVDNFVYNQLEKQITSCEKKGAIATLQVLLSSNNCCDISTLMYVHWGAKLISLSSDEMASSGLITVFNATVKAWPVTEETTYEFVTTVCKVMTTLIATHSGQKMKLLKSNVGGSDVASFVEVLGCISAALSKLPIVHIQQNVWDSILCFVTSLSTLCKPSKSVIQLLLAKCVCGVVAQLCDCLFVDKHEEFVESAPNLLLEWKEFYCKDIYTSILEAFIHVTDTELKKPNESILLCPGFIKYIESLCEAIINIDERYLLQHQLPPNLIANEEHGESTAADLQLLSITNHIYPHLLLEVPLLQITAYSLIKKLVPALMSIEENKFTTRGDTENGSDDQEQCKALPFPVCEVLLRSQEATEELLHDLRIGDTYVVDLHTDSYSFCLAYLLSWSLLLEMISKSTTELRYQYTVYLRNSGMMDVLLSSLFKLMPESVLLSWDLRDASLAATKRAKTYFNNQPNLSVKMCPYDLSHLACSVYTRCLECVPYLVHSWWTLKNKRVGTLIDGITTAFASPVVCAREMEALGADHKKNRLGSMNIQVRPSVREVSAVYSIEDCSMELVLHLPPNHPLGAMEVECGKRAGLSHAQWRAWVLQLTTFLRQQNGSLWEGLSLWQHNVERRFEGVEECCICYFVLHGATYQLPKLQCKTCKKKFHSACLYKWFNTSNNSACPLCRNLF